MHDTKPIVLSNIICALLFIDNEPLAISSLKAKINHFALSTDDILDDIKEVKQKLEDTSFKLIQTDDALKIIFKSERVKTCGRERILGDVDTYKEFTHTNTLLINFLDKAGDASRPILHNDKDSMIQSTYYGYGRQGTDSFKGLMTQVIWSSPAFANLTGKTSLYKSYNTNS